MTPEKRVQNSIVDYLKKLQLQNYPIYIERRQAGGFAYHEGLPDLFVIYNGVHIEIEVKQCKGSQRALQEKWELFFKKINCKYVLAKSLNQFKEFMKENFDI